MALATRQSSAIHRAGGSSARQEGLLLGRGTAVDGLGSARLSVSAAGVESIVVEALRDQDHIGDAEVTADCDGGRCEISHEGAYHGRAVAIVSNCAQGR